MRVILFLGDGTGTAHWSAALFAAESLAVQSFPVIGLVDTRNYFGRITDSGASATAYATGVATYNRAIGVGPDSVPLVSVYDVAERSGLSTGLVATSSVVHATPASFVAKVPDRYEYDRIAAQMAGSGLDVMLGGGRRYFEAAHRADGADLVSYLRNRHTYVEDAEDLRALSHDTVGSLAGLFAPNAMPPAGRRRPTLALMTRAALEVLDRNPQGFFLMVEGSQIDWRSHDNASLPEIEAEVLDFDAAIGAAVRYAERRPETLIVVTADHETGGLGLEADDGLAADYTTTDHTAELVPLFAAGPGAEHFAGILTNTDVGRLLLAVVGGAAGGSD